MRLANATLIFAPGDAAALVAVCTQATDCPNWIAALRGGACLPGKIVHLQAVARVFVLFQRRVAHGPSVVRVITFQAGAILVFLFAADADVTPAAFEFDRRRLAALANLGCERQRVSGPDPLLICAQ